MARFVAFKTARQCKTGTVEIADGIQHLVPGTFIVMTQAIGVEDTVMLDDQRIVQRAAQSKSLRLKRGDILMVDEGAAGSDLTFKHVP